MKQNNQPLAFTGRLFVDKLLAYEHPSLKLASPLRAGDIKLICVADRANGVRRYSGFFAAYIFDGKQWRKLALREGAAFKSAYQSDAERKRLFEELRPGLQSLKGKQAIWGDRAYWVKAQPAPAPATPRPEAKAPSGAASVKPASGNKPDSQLTLFN